MALYFNHSLIEKSTMEEVSDCIKEIMKIKYAAQSNEEILCFYQDLWNVHFSGTSLYEYLHQHDNKETAKGLLSTVMNGPYYFNNFEPNSLRIEPEVNTNDFCKTLMGICFKDNQHKIISLKREYDLTKDEYELKGYGEAQVNFDIINIIGEDELEKYFNHQLRFASIKEVFQAIESKYDNIIIFDSAVKSSKKHDFRGFYVQVYNGICSLSECELSGVLNGYNEERRKADFYTSCGLEISKESSETLNIDKYKKEREFLIPGSGRTLFEWHIKIDGNRTRIHYFIDKEEKKIYIGHCGKHLGTAGYNS